MPRRSKPGWTEIKSVEQFKALAEAARKTHDGFLASAAAIMTFQRAKDVRELRVDQECTWRGVAQICHEAWNDADWEPPSNQLAGMALCKVAAQACGEDHREEPWN